MPPLPAPMRAWRATRCGRSAPMPARGLPPCTLGRMAPTAQGEWRPAPARGLPPCTLGRMAPTAQGEWRPAPARGLPRGKNLHIRESERRHMQAGIRIRPALPPPLQRRKRSRCTRSSTCTGDSGMTRTGACMLRPGGGSGPRKPPACASHPLLGLAAGHRGAPASPSRLRQASAPSHAARAASSPATTRHVGAAADQACGTTRRMTRA